VQVTVTATDAGTGAPVTGRVLVNRTDVGPTGTAITTIFRTRRVGRPPDVEVVYPTVTVTAPGYRDADVDMGW
jgi:hypothetical protein